MYGLIKSSKLLIEHKGFSCIQPYSVKHKAVFISDGLSEPIIKEKRNWYNLTIKVYLTVFLKIFECD